MAPGILNKLRRRQSTSPHRPQSYVHRASSTPEWPISPAQVTPDVYLTSPAEDDGLLTSVCVHRAIEHEPKRLRKEGKHDSTPPVAASSALAAALASADEPGSPVSDSPPVFRRSSLQTTDVVMPKKPSEITKGSPLGRDKADEAAEAKEQGDGKQDLTRVSSGREFNEGLNVPKLKVTLRHRASKVLRSFTSRDNADKRASQPNPKAQTPRQHKRRNTLSDSSQSAFNMLAQASTAHALPRETSSGGVPGSPPPRSSGEGGRRRSSTLGHVEFAPRPGSPPRPPIPGAEDGMVDGASQRDSAAPIATLEPAAEIVTSSVDPTFDSLKGDKSKKLQRRRSKNAFSHLFALKGDKIFRSPPPAKATEDPVPPVPSIPEALAKAVADPDTPEVSQSSTVASTPTTTPKSSKSKRFKRHRRATIGSISQLPGDLPGTPSSTAQPEAPKTPTTPRTRTFTIVDLRKGFHVRGLGKSKGKLLSAKSNPEIRSPPPSARELSQASESSENPESPQRHRPPPLQSTESPQPAAFSIAVNGETDGSPETADFVASLDATDVLPSPIESTGPVTPVYGAPETPAPAPVSESPEQEAKVSSSSEEVPDLSYTATTDENEPPLRPSEASEATLLSDDPLFTALSAPSNLGDMQLQLREPSTKTSTLDAHLRIGSLRFEDFSFDTNVF